MWTYENGVLVALLLSAVRLALSLFAPLTVYAENLRRVGIRISLASGEWKHGGSWAWEMLGAVVLGLLFSLLSWLGVLLEIGYALWRRSRGAWAPPRVRELVWRLHNVRLSAADVRSTLFRLKEAAAGLPSGTVTHFEWEQDSDDDEDEDEDLSWPGDELARTGVWERLANRWAWVCACGHTTEGGSLRRHTDSKTRQSAVLCPECGRIVPPRVEMTDDAEATMFDPSPGPPSRKK